ncbi:TPA: hypothetical protein ACH7G7_005584, partial [Escherichia coli]
MTKLTVKVRFPNLFVSILNARHFEKPILRDSMSNIQKTITKIGKTNNTIAKKIVTFLYHLSLSAFSWLLSYLCLLRGFICVYKIHLYSLLSENLRMLIKNPISYFHIGTFLLSGKKSHLLEYWKAEVIMRDKFVFHRLIRNGMQRQRGFLLWWRLANE